MMTMTSKCGKNKMFLASTVHNLTFNIPQEHQICPLHSNMLSVILIVFLRFLFYLIYSKQNNGRALGQGSTEYILEHVELIWFFSCFSYIVQSHVTRFF